MKETEPRKLRRALYAMGITGVVSAGVGALVTVGTETHRVPVSQEKHAEVPSTTSCYIDTHPQELIRCLPLAPVTEVRYRTVKDEIQIPPATGATLGLASGLTVSLGGVVVSCLFDRRRR